MIEVWVITKIILSFFSAILGLIVAFFCSRFAKKTKDTIFCPLGFFIGLLLFVPLNASYGTDFGEVFFIILSFLSCLSGWLYERYNLEEYFQRMRQKE